MKTARVFWLLPWVVVGWAFPVYGHEGRKSRLLPPEGVESEARGEVKITPFRFEVKVKGLAGGAEFGVFLDDGTGMLVEVGTILTDDEGEGKLRFDARGGDDEDDDGDADASASPSLPFGVQNADQLGGRTIEIRNPDGMVMLEGVTPDVRMRSERLSGRTELARPDPATDEDAEGHVDLVQRDGRMVIKVKVEHLDPDIVYTIELTNPDTGETEVIGMLTTDEEGEGQLKIDTKKGDAIPFGAGSLAELEGFAIAVKNPDGAVVLEGVLGPIAPPPPEPKGEDEEEGESCLSSVDPDSPARGEVELEREEERSKLKVKVQDAAPSAVFTVVLVNPDDGSEAVAGEFTTSSRGRGELEIRSDEAAELPFGVASLTDLAGFGVVVRDADGADVLAGSVPELGVEEECPEEEDEDAPKLEIEAETSPEGDELEIEAEHLAPGIDVEIRITNPDTGDSETIAALTTDEKGEAEVELETAEGDVLPLGATSVADLAGFLVEVVAAGGTVLLSGTVPEPQEPGVDGEEEGDGDTDGGAEDAGDVAPPEGGGGLAEPDPFLVFGDFDSEFLRGDANGDTRLDLSDAVFTLLYLFAGGRRPLCLDAADANDDGHLDVGDAIYSLGYIFRGTAAPPEPGAFVSGFDPTPDALHCLEAPQVP